MKRFGQTINYDVGSLASSNYDVTFYRCRWNLDPAVNFISGSVTTHFTITAATNNIVFDMHNNLAVDSIIFRGSGIAFSRSPANAVQVNFGTNLAPSTKDSVSIYYKGVPANTGFGSFNLSSHNGVPVLWTLSEPYGAPTWWPCKDSNVDKPDSIDIIVSYPAQYVSSSNGLPVTETVAGGTKTTFWKHRYPVAPYLVAVAITNYDVDNDAVQLPSRSMPVTMYAYPENAAAFKSATQVAKVALQGFSSLYTEYPFSRERYAQTQFSWGGGMEHQTNSFIVSPGSGLVVHELAHQWFGDKVTCGSWQDLWLNEGFATYSEYIYLELTNSAALQPTLQSWNRSITNVPGGSVFVTDTTNLNRLFDSRLTYQKGGYLLHMLRWKVGDSAFFRGIRRYVNDPQLAYRSARTADLQRNLEAESGQNLSEFFRDWYLGEGYPNYTALWSQVASNTVKLQLNQTTSHPSVHFFEMPVPLLLRGSGRDSIFRVNHTRNGEVFTLSPGFKVDTVIIDPQLWVLSREKMARKSATPIGFDEVTIYPNPSTSRFTIAFPTSITPQYLQVEVFNALGQLVHSQSSASTAPAYIPAHRFASGLYWIRISGIGVNELRKVVVAR